MQKKTARFMKSKPEMEMEQWADELRKELERVK